MKKTTKNIVKWSLAAAAAGSLLLLSNKDLTLEASSHREAPLIANDPLADNTDLYAFRSPDDTNTVTIIANYVPFELPQGGPNYYSFGENIHYEIHIKNDSSKAGSGKDDITYRFTFTKTDEDSTAFFNIRLGKQNLKTSYIVEKSTDGGTTFSTIVTNGVVAPPNIGPMSIQGPAGLNIGVGNSYEDALRKPTIITAGGQGGEAVFAGPADDPFFVDLGGIFDLGETRGQGNGIDGLAKYNVHSIALKIPISTLQKDGKNASQKANILDGNFIIGVWASASRQQIKTLNTDGSMTESGAWVQVSRLGMPLTNEAVIPIGTKDVWNAKTPYTEVPAWDSYFTNPELALYMDTTQFGDAVPAFSALIIQTKSLGAYDFRDGKDGLFPLKGNAALDSTALSDAALGNYLLRAKNPRSVDILPIFYTGVPNIRPYQLATGKPVGNPLAAGKPFINNFLPGFGDMLRLNMAVPVTPRNSADFSSEGLLAAAVLGLTDPRFNKDASLQMIPNMDGFPNGRRLEDDVTRIELQAVSGAVLAAIGLWYDDYDPKTSPSPLTAQLNGVLTYDAGVDNNDTTFRVAFPYVQTPWNGFEHGGYPAGSAPVLTAISDFGLGIGAPVMNVIQNYPNPFVKNTTIKYTIGTSSNVNISVYNVSGSLVGTLVNSSQGPGTYETSWNSGSLSPGTYIASLASDGKVIQSVKMNITQ
jgi:hypothetical protein